MAMSLGSLTEERELRAMTGIEPGQAAHAVMWVFCSVATRTPRPTLVII
jgi:hypothetical protein